MNWWLCSKPNTWAKSSFSIWVMLFSLCQNLAYIGDGVVFLCDYNTNFLWRGISTSFCRLTRIKVLENWGRGNCVLDLVKGIILFLCREPWYIFWITCLIGSQIWERSPRNFERYLTIPISLRTAATSSGFLILRIAFTSTGSGFRPFVREWPMNCTSLHLNVNCFLLSLMLRWLHQSIFICLMLCFSLTSDQYIVSYFEDSVQSSKVLVKFHLKNFQG